MNIQDWFPLGLTGFISLQVGLFLTILFFCCNGEWNCFLNISDFSLLVYRNARDFCILILYPATLPNSGFSMYNIMSSTEWQLYFFSSTGSFDFFSLIAMTRTCESNCYMLIEMSKLSEELRALKHILQFFAFYTSFLLVYVRIKHKNKTNKKDWNRKMFSIKCLTI